MNINMYLAFLKWCFMKMFGGCFNLAAEFRYELKRGDSHSAIAIVGYVLLSLVSFMILSGLTLWVVTDREILSFLLRSYLCIIAITFVYNVVRAAFECFLDEREELVNTLKKDYS